MTLTNAIAQNI